MSVVHIILKTVALWPLSLCVLFSSSAAENLFSPANYRLPDNVVPLSYKIKLIPDMEGDHFTFSGKSEINISVKKPTTVITLHAKNLNIDDVIKLYCRLHDSPSEIHTFAVLNHSIDIETDFLKIHLEKELPADSNCNLTLNYNSTDIHDNKNTGFFDYSYSENGTTKRMAATHFEPSDARKAFPCWDEPALKAYFSISIKHEIKYLAFSNMHIVGNEKNLNNLTQVTHFAQSPKMSTYLVAVVVGDFIPAVDNDNVKFRFWTRRNLSYDAEYVQKIGLEALDILEKYLNFSYEAQGYQKIDMIAIPNLRVGAMENWGLITCHESSFVLTENSPSILQKEMIATTIIHELVHQWFGNLVTMSWWNYLWLNEGFATYFENIIVDEIEPMWGMKERSEMNNVREVMMRDERKVVHEIEYQWNVRAEIINFADNYLNYEKSATILRMISYVLGEQKFQAALRRYTKAQAFKSVTSQDLFFELSDGNCSLIGFMKNWVTQPGYPLITVTRDYEGKKARVTQSRFLVQSKDTSEERYWIPLNFATEDKLNFNDTEVTHWFHPSRNAVDISELEKNQFVIFNKQQFGLYRVNYDEKNWQLIATYLRTKNHNDIHVLNRAQLINDAFALANIGKLQYNIVLSLMAYLEKETDYIVWVAVFPIIEDMKTVLAYTKFDKPFENYFLKLVGKLFTQIQSVNDNENNHVMRLNRINALKLACCMKTALCRSEASKIVARCLKNPDEARFSSDEKEWVWLHGLQHDNQETWDKLWKNESNLFLPLLYTYNVTIFEKYLLKSISEVTFNKAKFILKICVRQFPVTNATLSFAIQHYKDIIALDGYSDNKENYIISLAKVVNTQNQRNKLIELFQTTEDFPEDVVHETFRIIAENMKRCNEEIEKFSSDLNQFFKNVTIEKNRLEC